MIYFIQCKTYLKVGYSKDPANRLKELQTGNPFELKLLGTIEGNYATEAGFHIALETFRHTGEWFKLKGKLKACIQAMKGIRNCPNAEITNLKTFLQAGAAYQTWDNAKRNNKKTLVKRIEVISKNN